MKIAMLWYDNSTTLPFDKKVLQAAAYYAKKYEKIPNACHVHPSMAIMPVEGIEIRTTNSVMPNHFWIGVNEDAG